MYRNTKNVPYYVFGRGSLAQLGDLLNPRREAVDGLRAAFGEDHPLVAGALLRLSACLYMQRDLDGAEELLLKARDVFEKQPGNESRMDVSTCLNNLGRIREERGDLEQGIALHRQAAAIRKLWIPCRKPWTAMPAPDTPAGRTSKATARILRSAAMP